MLLKSIGVALLFGLSALAVLAEGTTLPQEANQERALKIVSDLSAPSMKGRLTGSPSGMASEKYVEAALRTLPLEVRVQEVRFPLYEVHSPIALELVDDQGQVIKSLAYIDDYREVDFSGSGEVTGDLVFAGHGIEAPGINPYEKVDVKGRIAVLLTGLPEGIQPEQARVDVKLDGAFRHGAKGVIFVTAGKMAKAVDERGPEAKMWAVDLKRDFHPELHHPQLPALFLKKDAIPALLGVSREELENDPAPRVLGRRAHLSLKGQVYPEAKSRNFFGILKGSDPELGKEVVIVGAHYDHLGLGGDGRIFFGAADNATGTAVVLETARTLSTCGIKPKRTVIFALWCGEEQGLFGSKHYVEKDPLFPLADTKLMIQVDYLGEKEGPFLTNLDQNPMVQTFVGSSVQEGRFQPIDWGGKGASDDVPFKEKGVPAYRFIAYGEHHHVPTDTMANLNPAMLKKVANSVVLGLTATAY